MSWIARALPNLVPGLGALLNPWLWAGAVAVVSGTFLYGLHVGNDRLEAYQAAAKEVGLVQDTWRKAHIAEQNRISQEVVDGLHNAQTLLLTDNGDYLERLRLAALEKRSRDGSSVGQVPAAGSTPGRDPQAGVGSGIGQPACPTVGELRRRVFDSLAGNVGRFGPGLQRSGSALIAAQFCARWADEQGDVGKGN